MGETAQRTALWLLLGGWIGSWGCFGMVVAPTAFRVLPTETAGQLVGPVLTALHLYGVVAGIGLAALAATLGRGRLLVALPLVMAALCLFTQLWVTARIEEVRPFVFGPQGSLELATRFTRLHQLSMTIFISVSAAAIALLFLHARADARSGDKIV